MKQYKEYRGIIERILDNINNIEDLLQSTTEDSFLSNLKDYNALCLEFIQIGEKVNMLDDDFYDKHPEIPWHELYGLRNRIVHGYDKVNKAIIWSTIIRDIPVIKVELLKLL